MKKNAIIFICFLAYLIIPLQANSQQQEPIKETLKTEFSLNEAIQYALQHNRQVKNASLSIKAAEKQKWETIATGLPQIDAKLEYSNSFIRPSALSAAPEPGSFSPAFFFPKHKATPSVTLTQLIFDGSYIVGLQSAKVFLEISNNAKIKTDKEIEKAVVSAYNNALLTKESILILEKNIKNLTDNIKETKALLTNGFVEEEDLEQLQLTLNDLNNNLENLHNLEDISKNFLKLLMGYDTTQNITIADSLNILADEISLSSTKNEEISVFKNIDYKIAENTTESKRLLYKLELARKLPSIGSYLNAGYFGQSDPSSNDEFRFFKKDQVWFGTATFGFQLDIPIFSSFKSIARIKRAKIDWKISQNELENTKEEIKITIEKAKTELQLALNTLNNKKKNLNLAERIERKNNTKYTEGIASSFELRQAQIQLYSSQQEYLQAMVNVINKEAELKALKN
ncbi:TolC family protein [Wenyingzhuangia aestuarii]|uniref:TolC family protein n=1 Tax=Wenyingzhuangia aestuarii TaxID=1647582 RepID=UPI00143BF5FB|nr:TolC family protein [Wenyingzhuangia aestuarii]NJB83150.1 outer membrane protein TolC [Wenyingzhuangia aestuarii]